MNGIDTNLLLRLILGDDRDQVMRIKDLLKGSTDDLVANDLVIAETVWTLQKAMGASREEIIIALDTLTTGIDVRPLDVKTLELARHESERHGFGIADGLIGARNAAAGCETTYTFDRRAARSALFTIVP